MVKLSEVASKIEKSPITHSILGLTFGVIFGAVIEKNIKKCSCNTKEKTMLAPFTSTATNPDTTSTFYVYPLPPDMTDVGLISLFNQAGIQILEARVITDRNTGKSKNYGFITINASDERNVSKLNIDLAININLKIRESLPRYGRIDKSILIDNCKLANTY